jgi:hypothetical protein
MVDLAASDARKKTLIAVESFAWCSRFRYNLRDILSGDWLRAGRPRDRSSSPGYGARPVSYPVYTGGSFAGGIAAGA